MLERALQCLVDADRPDTLKRVYVVENGKKEGAEAKVDKFRDRLPIDAATRPLAASARRSISCSTSSPANSSCSMTMTFESPPMPCVRMRMPRPARPAASSTLASALVDYDAPPPEWLKHYLPYSAKGWRLW